MRVFDDVDYIALSNSRILSVLTITYYCLPSACPNVQMSKFESFYHPFTRYFIHLRRIILRILHVLHLDPCNNCMILAILIISPHYLPICRTILRIVHLLHLDPCNNCMILAILVNRNHYISSARPSLGSYMSCIWILVTTAGSWLSLLVGLTVPPVQDDP